MAQVWQKNFFDNACQFVVATREPFVFLTETSNCDHSCETTRNVKKLEVLVLGCNPARPSPRTWRASLAFRQRQVPPGNARGRTATPQGNARGCLATPRDSRQRPVIRQRQWPSGNASGHTATPGAIRQRQMSFGNAKCDLDAADAPGDASGSGEAPKTP